ncbi:hypothetical protein [Natronomonas sp. EA1]|uniref:hypothetical protein n=1 Tax=Natronomonas sp. EA1 TaxID=3421655 RepID=UPI003EBBED19
MRVRPALLALLLVLAGCSALAPGGDTTPEPTLTPAPVPEDTPSPTRAPPERLAPGLTTAGVDNATALAAAHATRLNGTYVLRRNVTVRNTNINVVARSRSVIRDNGTHERYQYTPLFGGPRLEYYHTNGTAWRRSVENGTVTYDRTTLEPWFDGSAFDITTLLARTDARVVDRERAGATRRYELVARDVDEQVVFTPEGIRNVTAVTVAASVVSDSNGTHVEHFVIWYRGEHERQPVTAELRLRFTPRDRLAVPAPAWLPEARNRTASSA